MVRTVPAAPRDFFFQSGRGTGRGSASDQQIRVLLRFAGRLDLGRLRAALAAVVAEDPILRARFVEERPFVARWELGEAPAPACELAESGDPDAAEAAVRAFLADLEIRPDGPYFRVRVIRGPAGDALCLRVDHRLCDGGGTKLLAYRLCDRYRRLGAGAPLPPPRADPAPRTLAGLTGRVAPPAPPGAPPLRALTYALPRRGFENERPALAVRVVAAETVAAVRRAGKPLGATLTDAMLVALTRALAPHATVPPGEPLAVMVSADLRARLPPGTPEALGNLSQGFMPPLRCDPARPFREALAETAQAMAGIRAGLTLDDALSEEAAYEASFRRWMADPELFFSRAARATTFVLLSNVGVLDEPCLDLGGPALSDAQLLGTVALGRELLLCASSFRGALTLSTGYCASDVDPERIEGTVERMAAELERFGGR
jgi:NRPS condensation-like uncharacterized protein